MLDKQRAAAAVRALNKVKIFDLPEEEVHLLADARNALKAIAEGDTIASLWSIDDVQSLRPDCDVSQLSKDGEDDGLTWFHCDTHNEDTLDENVCEEAPDTLISDETARRVLEMADNEHDAEVGINWETLRVWLDYVEGDK